jgi:hypothetical protein
VAAVELEAPAREVVLELVVPEVVLVAVVPEVVLVLVVPGLAAGTAITGETRIPAHTLVQPLPTRRAWVRNRLKRGRACRWVDYFLIKNPTE